MSGLVRFSALVVVAAIGWSIAAVFGLDHVAESPGYLLAVNALLAIGLFSSTYGISRSDLRENLRTVLVAVTAGVLAKAAIICGVMYLLFRRPEYAVLGLAVAQVDPLSVAAINRRSRMSPRAKSILSAWASFDDPITMLLTVYVSTWVLGVVDAGAAAPLPSTSGDLRSIGLNLAQNVAFASGAFVLWRAATAIRGRLCLIDGVRRRNVALAAGRVLLGLVLLVLLAFAVRHFLMLGVAVIGLFFRPTFIESVQWVTQAAFFAAAFALGLVLVGGVRILPGIALGVAAYCAHIVVGLSVTWRLPEDRVYLALGQQNGITAIILALLLESSFPGTVAVVAPAILVVALLYGLANGAWDRRVRASHASEPTTRGRRRKAGSAGTVANRLEYGVSDAYPKVVEHLS